jgi:Response regulators consisting of a CheY-like receiver domain and a winged-helix DNA-binding domain
MNADCLIIGLSAHAMMGDKERYMEEGMDDYLTKPVDLKELEALIKRYLRPVRGMMLWR